MLAMLTPEFIESDPELERKLCAESDLAHNMNLPITYIIDRIMNDKQDVMIAITSRNDFTWDLVNKYPQYKWNFEDVGSW